MRRPCSPKENEYFALASRLFSVNSEKVRTAPPLPLPNHRYTPADVGVSFSKICTNSDLSGSLRETPLTVPNHSK